VLAQDEARAFRHDYIGTEHVLLGLLREERGVAARALGSLNVTLDDARGRVERLAPRGTEVSPSQLPFTRAAKQVLESALRESRSLGDDHVGSGHVLLGLVDQTKDAGARILLELKADTSAVRSAVSAALTAEDERD